MFHQLGMVVVSLGIVIVLVILFKFIRFTISVYRFLRLAFEVIFLYENIFSDLLELDFEEQPITVFSRRHELNFSSTNGASIEMERIVNEALRCYDRLGNIVNFNDYFEEIKERLLEIGAEIRVIRMKPKSVE